MYLVFKNEIELTWARYKHRKPRIRSASFRNMLLDLWDRYKHHVHELSRLPSLHKRSHRRRSRICPHWPVPYWDPLSWLFPKPRYARGCSTRLLEAIGPRRRRHLARRTFAAGPGAVAAFFSRSIARSSNPFRAPFVHSSVRLVVARQQRPVCSGRFSILLSVRRGLTSSDFLKDSTFLSIFSSSVLNSNPPVFSLDRHF